MPNKHTFLIKPIGELVKKYVGNGKSWIDPFAGENSPAEITNDLNPAFHAMFTGLADCFIDQLCNEYDDSIKYEGCLFDPPYSLRQVKECYKAHGIELMSQKETQYFPTYIKDMIAPIIKLNGIVICCGWDSNAFGLARGFELVEILLVAHGGRHNDTIVTVEKKVREQTVMDFK